MAATGSETAAADQRNRPTSLPKELPITACNTTCATAENNDAKEIIVTAERTPASTERKAVRLVWTSALTGLRSTKRPGE